MAGKTLDKFSSIQ